MDAAARSGVMTSPTNALARTAKSCGPGIPVLMPSRRATSAQAMGARQPVPKEITYKS